MSKKVALVGYGYWGKNLLRNFFENPDCEVLYCCDTQIAKLKEATKKYPALITTTRFEEVLQDPELDAVIIATPTKHHFPIGKKAIEAGKDVLIEKPMTTTSKQARDLLALAVKRKRILMVDHTFLFNEAVRKVKSIIDSGEIGDVLYIDSIRANLGLFQDDVNVVFDLASHDFSIMQYFLEDSPKSVQAFGRSHFNRQEDVCYIATEYGKKIFTHIHVSWLSPLKVRMMTIVGTKKMIVYNDVEPAEKVRVYDKGVTIKKGLTKKLEEMNISYRSGDVSLPNIKGTEALSLIAREFIESITKRKTPRSDGKLGLTVVNLLEKTNESVRTGKKVLL